MDQPETRELKRATYLAQLDATCSRIERVAEHLPARGEPFPRDRMRTVLYDLLVSSQALVTARENTWAWATEDVICHPHRHVRAAENLDIVKASLTGLEEAQFDGDDARGLNQARDAIDHLRRCTDHLRIVLENRETGEKAA